MFASLVVRSWTADDPPSTQTITRFFTLMNSGTSKVRKAWVSSVYRLLLPLSEQYVEINTSTPVLPLQIVFQPMSYFKFQSKHIFCQADYRLT
jgi:hypothetical protein